MVTNCSKERPGSIVTETLKNEILIPIVTPIELNSNADFKFINFIKIDYTHQKLEARENLHNFRELRKTPPKSHTILKSHHQIQRIREPYCRSFRLLSRKMWNLVFFARRQITNVCLFVCLFFVFFFLSPGLIVSNEWSGPTITQKSSF